MILWHPVTSNPVPDEPFLATNGKDVFRWEICAKEQVAFRAVCDVRGFTHWCYVKDLASTVYEI